MLMDFRNLDASSSISVKAAPSSHQSSSLRIVAFIIFWIVQVLCARFLAPASCCFPTSTGNWAEQQLSQTTPLVYSSYEYIWFIEYCVSTSLLYFNPGLSNSFLFYFGVVWCNIFFIYYVLFPFLNPGSILLITQLHFIITNGNSNRWCKEAGS
jgi:hypothetical protein